MSWVRIRLLVKLKPYIFLSWQECPQLLSVVHLLEVMCQNFKNVTKLDKSRIFFKYFPCCQFLCPIICFIVFFNSNVLFKPFWEVNFRQSRAQLRPWFMKLKCQNVVHLSDPAPPPPSPRPPVSAAPSPSPLCLMSCHFKSDSNCEKVQKRQFFFFRSFLYLAQKPFFIIVGYPKKKEILDPRAAETWP